MTTGDTCENEGDFDSFTTKKLLRCKRKGLLLGAGCAYVSQSFFIINMYKSSNFPIKNNIKMKNSKAKGDSYMPCVAMANSTKY